MGNQNTHNKGQHKNRYENPSVGTYKFNDKSIRNALPPNRNHLTAEAIRYAPMIRYMVEPVQDFKNKLRLCHAEYDQKYQIDAAHITGLCDLGCPPDNCHKGQCQTCLSCRLDTLQRQEMDDQSYQYTPRIKPTFFLFFILFTLFFINGHIMPCDQKKCAGL